MPEESIAMIDTLTTFQKQIIIDAVKLGILDPESLEILNHGHIDDSYDDEKVFYDSSDNEFYDDSSDDEQEPCDPEIQEFSISSTNMNTFLGHYNQLERNKEILTEYYRIWLLIEYPDVYDHYLESLDYGRFELDWTSFFELLPVEVSNDPVANLAMCHLRDIWSNFHQFPARNSVQEIAEESETWNKLIDVVYKNLSPIQDKREELIEAYLN